MRLPGLAIRNFQFTLLILLMLVLSGLFSFFTMSRSEDPRFTSPGAVVFVVWPGASTLEIEEQVVRPLEDALRKIDYIKEVNSSSFESVATMAMEYEYGVNFEKKYQEVVQELNAIRSDLPDGITEFRVNAFSPADVNIYQLAFISETLSYREMESYAERLGDQIELSNTVRAVEIFGVPEREIKISLNKDKLAQLKISLTRVLGSIQESNKLLPAGSLEIGGKSFNVISNSRYESIEEIEATVVASSGGKAIYLRDIATVAAADKKEIYKTRFNGERAIFLTVQQKSGTNIFDLDDEVKPWIKDAKDYLPSELRLEMAFDQTNSVSERVNDFFLNLFQGMVLVILVILLFVGFRAAILIGIAIPISIIIGLGFVDLFGFGIQQISIAGLVISLGLLVDNAIVVVENVARFMEMGYPPRKAAIEGAKQVAWPITSATFTTVFAFLPILLIQDASGDFLKSMPVTVIITILASLVVALTLTPFLASRFFHPEDFKKQSRIKTIFERIIHGPYKKLLNAVLRLPIISLILGFVMFIASLLLFPLIGLSFFPKAEKPIFLVNVELPVGSSLEETDRIVREVEQELLAMDAVKHIASNIGRDNPKIYYNVFPSERIEYSGQLLVELKEYDQEDFSRTISEIDGRFEDYPGAQIWVQEFEQGAPVFAPIAFRIIGSDIKVLKELGEEMKDIFEKDPGTSNVFNALKNSKTDLRVKVNKSRAASLGVRMEAINVSLRTALGGVELSNFSDPSGNILDITVGLAGREDFQLSDFEKVYVESVSGALIPLQQLAEFEFSSDPVLIRHFNFERSVAVSADAKRGYNVNTVTTRLQNKIDQMRLPPGYRYIVSGQVASMGDALNGIGQAAILAFICIFAILVLQFRSFGQPFIIFSAMPLAMIGSLVALYLSGYNASFTAFVGLTSLIGIVVNDSIILIDFINQARREGKAKLDAIREAGAVRFVPIILTSLTTIGGLLPLTLRGGTLWAPMGWTIIGGLVTSTFLILLLVPALYKIFSTDDESFMKRLETYKKEI